MCQYIIKNQFFLRTSLYWLLLLIFLFIFHANHPLDSDEGVVLNGAWNLINGRNLYFDFFEYIPPGSFYLIFGLWEIFGIGYWTARFAAIFIIFLGCFGIYKISKEIYVKSKFNYLGPTAFAVSSLSWPVINHNTFNITFIILAVYFAIKGLSVSEIASFSEFRTANKNFSIAGLLTGFSIIFLQQKGLALLIAISFYLFISSIYKITSNKSFIATESDNFGNIKPHNKSAIIWLRLKTLAYYLLFSVFPLSVLFLNWPAKMLYEKLIVFPFLNYSETNRIPYNLLFVFLIYTLFAAFVLRNEIRLNARLQLLLFVQFALLLTTIPNPDFYHIGLVIFPLYCLLSLVIEKTKQFKLKTAIFCHSIIWPLIFKMTLPALLGTSPFSMMNVDSYVAITYVKKNCPRPNDLYAGPFLPGVYFETKKISPTPYSFLLTKLHTEDQFDDARKHLEIARPACAILNRTMVEKYKYITNNPVDEFISENYEKVFQEGNMEVFRLKTN